VSLSVWPISPAHQSLPEGFAVKPLLGSDPSWAGQDPNNKNCRAPVLRSEDVLLAYSLLITVPRCSDRSRPKLDIRPVDGPGRRRHNHLAKLVSEETRKPLRSLGAAPGGPGAQSVKSIQQTDPAPWIGSIPGAKVKIIRNKESKCALYEVPIPCQQLALFNPAASGYSLKTFSPHTCSM
jgi:hypothetical protein